MREYLEIQLNYSTNGMNDWKGMARHLGFGGGEIATIHRPPSNIAQICDLASGRFLDALPGRGIGLRKLQATLNKNSRCDVAAKISKWYP